MIKATQQQTKKHNSQLVLETIYNRGKISRADVARATQLTRTTVSNVVAELMARGLVEEVGLGTSGVGKTPMLLSVVTDSYHLIGVEVASDEVRGAIVNLRGEIIRTAAFPISSRNGEEALALVYQLLDQLVAASDRPLLGIGIGTPGLVDTDQGRVHRAVNLDWDNLPLGELLKARFHLPVYLANDSQAAALAEYTFGNWPPEQNLIVIKVGQGIGAGIILGGRLFQGDGSSAGEIGHMVMVEDGRPCRCGQAGCLETVASVRAMLERAADLAQTAPQSPLGRGTPAALTMARLQVALEAGDGVAQQVVAEAGHFLGRAVASLVSTLNVRQILLAGPIDNLGQPFLNMVQREMRRYALSPLAEDTQITFGRVGSKAVILGASALLLTHELGLSLAHPA
jgi:N-acetylglucosamine repressor